MKFSELLAMLPAKRTPQDYEAMFDDFIASMNGRRISDAFEIPEGKGNADCLLDFGSLELVLELKQLTKPKGFQTVDAYFSELIRQRRAKSFRKLEGGKVRIDPGSLTREEWNLFYRKFRPAVEGSLYKARAQLKDTISFLPPSDKRRIKGVAMLNSGDFNLSTDLLHRLVEQKMKAEWKQGCFTSIDFVSCMSIDMYVPGTHPLHTRHIARSKADADIVFAAQHFFQGLVSYVAKELGRPDQKVELSDEAALDIDVNRTFQGKLQWTPPER